MTLTIKLDGNWSSFQLANSAPPLSVTDSAIAPSARMDGGQGLERVLSDLFGKATLQLFEDVGWVALVVFKYMFKKCSWSTRLPKNCESHIDASHSRQPLVKGERLVRYEVNAVTD